MIQRPEDLLALDPGTLLNTWIYLEAQNTQIKLLESTARRLVVEKFFDPSIKKGSLHYQAGAAELTVVKALNYKLSSEKIAVENVKEMLTKHSEAGRLAAENVFKIKYELDAKVYEALPKELKDIVSGIVVISEAMPSLKVTLQ